MEKQSPLLAGKHIVVAGAGIAGLSFVRALHRFWPDEVPRPDITVYERDPRHLPSERGNYSLALRSDRASRGLQALQRLALIDQVFAARVLGSESALLLRDRQWRTIANVVGGKPAPDGLPCERMRITRNDIRECLIQATEADAQMEWSTSCTTAATCKDGRVELGLSDGSTTTCDLLLVGDGAGSKLRGLLRPDDKLQFAGAVMIGGQASFAQRPKPTQLVQGGGGMVLGGDGHALVVFPTTPDDYVWFITQRSAAPCAAIKGDDDDTAAQRAIVAPARREGAVFGEPFMQLLAATEPNSLKTMNARDKPSIAHTVLARHPYIFIGDSNHAVSPFAGNGANLALLDGVSLAEALCTSPTLEQAAARFDAESTPRCQAALRKSHLFIAVVHCTGWRFWLLLAVLRVLGFLFFRR